MHRLFKAIVQVLLVAGFAFGLASHASAQTAEKCTLTVKVTGIRNAEGNIRVTLRRDPQTTVKGKIVQIDPRTLTATAVFEGVTPGTYDVAVIHDENKNGQLDFNDMGMPLEGYGHSNNPAKQMGPPRFEESKFNLSDRAKSIEIE